MIADQIQVRNPLLHIAKITKIQETASKYHIRRKSTDISKELALKKLKDPKLKTTCNSLKSVYTAQTKKIDTRKQTN
jgi:hypothetical protein